MIDPSLLIQNPKSLIKKQIKHDGIYANVYETTDPEIVMKEPKIQPYSEKDGWLIWALMTFMYKKIWMPKIYSIYIKKTSDGFMYRALIERLRHPTGYVSSYDIYIPEYRISGNHMDVEIPQMYLEEMGFILQEMENIFSKRMVRFDLHDKNWMIRITDNTEVITDPFAEHYLEDNIVHNMIKETQKENPESIHYEV